MNIYTYTHTHIYIYIYIIRLASNKIFSPSNKIHREVGQPKELSAPLEMQRVFLHLHDVTNRRDDSLYFYSETLEIINV